jgi:CheY-like chemotaxis protein
MDFTMLWVEDDADDILIAQRAFLKAGLPAPRVARDGEEALAYLTGKGAFGDRASYPAPSIVLLDLKLPRISGLELLRRIRQDPELRRLPVIIHSSSAERHDIVAAYDSGATAYLVKSIDTTIFCDMLKALRDFWMTFNRTADPTP